MNPTNIEWVRNPGGSQGFTSNPFVGCSGEGCVVRKVCYAMKQAKRQKQRCLKCYDFVPHFHHERWCEIEKRKKPTGIFLGSEGEAFDKAFTIEDIEENILSPIETCEQHLFYILTKQAQRLKEFCLYPKNLALGVTVNTQEECWRITYLRGTDAKVKFVSFEPLYDLVTPDLTGMNWVIIGAQTNPELQPHKKWVEEIILKARWCHVPVFVKNNLQWYRGVQEFPKELRM